MQRRLTLYACATALVAALVCLLAVLSVDVRTHGSIYSSVAALPATEAALVPGASVLGTSTLSQVLKERADEAVLLYKAGKVKKILVSGDNSTLSHDEVNPVGNYLLMQGVPMQDIFLDHAGFDTYSSMYRAQAVFEVTSMTIVSQPFHLPRAVYLAQSLGLTVYGLDASHGEPYVYNYLREIPATIKAVYDVAVNRVPEYLGRQYPIEGDGSPTWFGDSGTTQATSTSQ